MPTLTAAAPAEAEYLVIAPGGITTSSGRHAHSATVWLSDLDGAEERLGRLGLVMPTGNRSRPPKRERNGDPDWIDPVYLAAVETARQRAEAGPAPVVDSGLPEDRQTQTVIEAQPDAHAALAEVLSEQPAPAIAVDADPTAVVTQPVPAVIRFAQAHPEQVPALLRAERRRPKPRSSLLRTLAALTTKEA